MRKILIGVVVLIALLVVALLVAPGFIDWNRYKPEIARMAERATGRRLTIDGDLSLSILPTPTLSAHTLRLANLDGAATPDMLRLKALDIRIGLLALLSGTIEVESVTLVEPEVELEVLADGRRNWDFTPAGGTGTPAAPAAPAAQTEGGGPTEAGAGVGADALRLDRLSIENGTVSYLDSRTGRVDRLEALDAEVSAQSLAGPFAADGKFTYRGLALGFDGRLGRLVAGGEAPLSFVVTLPGAEVRLTRGAVALGDGGVRFAGRLRATGDDLRRLAGWAAGAASGQAAAVPAWLAQPFSIEATVNGAGKALALNDVALEIGDTRATGAIDLGFETGLKVDVALSVQRIDLDKWLDLAPATPAPAAAPAKGPAVGAKTEGAAAPRSAAAGAWRDFVLPPDLTGSLDIGIDAIAYRGGVVQDARLAVTVDGGIATISRASAALPGGSTVQFTGVLEATGGPPAFRGGFAGRSDNLRALLDWLAVPMGEVPAGRLRAVDIKGKLAVSPEELRVTDLALAFDSSKLTGAATVALRRRPAFGLAIELDRLDLDAYLPRPAAAGAGKGSGAGGEDQTPAKAADSGRGETAAAGPLAAAGLLDRFDANVTARIGALTFNRQLIKGIRFDGQVYDGALSIRTAEVADFAGGRGKIKGSLRELGTTPVVDLAFELSAPDAARVMKLAGITPPEAVAKAGAMRLEGSAKGTVKNLKIDTKLAAFAGNMRFAGALTGLDAALGWDLRVTARFPELGPVLAALGVAVPKGKLGALDLNGVTKGTPEAAALDVKIATGAGEMTLKGNVAGLLHPAPRFDLALDARRFQPQFLVAFIADPVTRALVGGIEGLDGTVSAKGTLDALNLRLEGLNARAFGGTASATGTVALDAAPNWNLRVTAGFPELRPVLAALGVTVPRGKLGALNLKGETKGSAESATLDIEITTGAGEMTLKGNVAGLMRPAPKFDLALDARRFRPQVLVAFIADPGTRALVGGIEGLDGKVSAKGTLDALELKLAGVQGRGFGGTAGVAGGVALGGKAPRLDLDLDIRDIDLVRLGAATGMRYRPLTPAVPFSLAGRFTGTLGQQIEGTGLKGRFGYIDNRRQIQSTSFNGTVRAALAGARPKYTVELGFGDLFVDPYLARDQRQGELPPRYRLIPGVIRAATPTIQPPAQARRIPWTRTPIDAGLLREFDADIVLKGNGLTYGRMQIHQPRMTLALANGVLQVRQLAGGFTEGGTINLTGSVDARDAISLNANVTIDNADVHRAVGWFTEVKRVAGRLTIAGSLRARGRSQAELIAALNGKLKVSGSIRPGKKLDAGFAQMIACLGVSSALGDTLKQLGGPVTGGGVFGQYLDLATVVLANGVGDVSGDIQIDNGHIWSRNIRVIGRQAGGQAIITGDVRLPAYTVYGQVELVTPESIRYSQQIGRPAPYVLAEYAADLDGNDKRTRIDGLINDGNFKQTNCKGSPLGGVLGGKLGDVLGGVLGGGQKAPQPQPGQQPPPAKQPQDLLKDLLGGGLGDILKKQ